MQNAIDMTTETTQEAMTGYLNKVLIVDDNEPEKFRLSAMLKKLNYQVSQASNAEQALEMIRQEEFALVLSDWMMPGMSGLDLCREVHRDEPNPPYFILVTGRDTTSDLVAGIDAGADDFITKPYNGEELLVRVRAGQRSIKMRHKLESQKVELQKHIQAQNEASEQSRKDLELAAEVLNEHLPENQLNNNGYNAYGLLKSANSIGGDFYNYFRLDKNHVAFYAFDVVGHGVPAALFAFMLARSIVPGKATDNFLTGINGINRPSHVVQRLNERFLNKSSTPLYFTMTYGVLNIKTGNGQLCQAGSPYSIICSSTDGCQQLGDGGYPVGIIPGADYEDTAFKLDKGDRLMLYSDGIIEAENEQKNQLGVDRLKSVFERNKNASLKVAVDACYQISRIWSKKDAMDDDISMLAIEIPIDTTSDTKGQS